ncbi:NAD(P)/FAD-dependent oxidoreductase [Paraburkholderia tropica]|uniref:NAD(P)/FAD-dependent oxidoreductase n=1 Tax=Paraburkholderia tropica TaxID=92647 RepID=UPI002AB1E0F9|nr:NAD(P)/FAD-dependent oxidoreductase [Paraburkholderia tropica]
MSALLTQTEKLEENIRNALKWQGPYPANWVPPHPGVDHDVVIVGGGQTGVAAAYGLRRRGVARVSVIDAAREGESMWTSIARMNLLRTPKFMPGPELGNTLLSFRAWYETQRGAEAFDALPRISRTDWAAYLEWFRKAVNVEVRHETRLLDIEPVKEGLRLHLDVKGERRSEITRKLVLATGFAGGGGSNVPDFIRTLPKSLWAHTNEQIDFVSLKGRRVAVLGVGPSGFDAAAVALETGAGAVHLFSRRDHITYAPNRPPAKMPFGKFFPGAEENFPFLPDDVRWRHQSILDEAGASTPVDSIDRATRFDHFHIHLGVKDLRIEPSVNATDGLVFLDGDARHEFDFLIAATGFRVDLGLRPELRNIAGDILLWGDRYQPEWGERNPVAELYPYLGQGFEFLEKVPGRAPWLADIHCFNIAASLSIGRYVSDIPSLSSLPLLIKTIVRDLFLADYDHHLEEINGPSLFSIFANDMDPYKKAIWNGA